MAVRMRFPPQALEELRRDDPNTKVTLNLIRTLVRQNIIPSVPIGRRHLLNYDALVEYLASPHTCMPPEATSIRCIKE